MNHRSHEGTGQENSVLPRVITAKQLMRLTNEAIIVGGLLTFLPVL